MSRPTRVPYHQNVYDLLDLPPGECPDARRLIDAHEAAHGPLPASVREWYLVPNATPLDTRDRDALVHPAVPDTFMRRYSNADFPLGLADVLERFDEQRVTVLIENQGVCTWGVEPDDSDDPPVVQDNDPWADESGHLIPVGRFSRFVWNWVRFWHAMRNEPGQAAGDTGDPHAAGVWACSPPAPVRPAVFDFLADRLDADPPQLVGDGVVRHTFRSLAGVIRVTADHPDWPTPHAAWWAEADTPDRLAELLAPLRPWGVLGDDARRPVTDPWNADPFADA